MPPDALRLTNAGVGRRWLVAVIAGLFVLGVFVVLLWLGFWQLERAAYKDALAGRFAQNEAQPPEAPKRLLDGAGPAHWQFRRTRLQGEFDVDRQYLLDNRTHEGRAGYHVLSPLRTQDGAILVNRGWVPVGEDRGVLPDITLSPEPVTVTGRLVAPPAGGLLLGESGHDSAQWPKVIQTVDLERMSQALGAPLMRAIVALDDSQRACLVCDWKPVAGVSADRHRGYAVQWFALAGALVVLLIAAGLKSVRRNGR